MCDWYFKRTKQNKNHQHLGIQIKEESTTLYGLNCRLTFATVSNYYRLLKWANALFAIWLIVGSWRQAQNPFAANNLERLRLTERRGINRSLFVVRFTCKDVFSVKNC